jgi:hypothetical protein
MPKPTLSLRLNEFTEKKLRRLSTDTSFREFKMHFSLNFKMLKRLFTASLDIGFDSWRHLHSSFN